MSPDEALDGLISGLNEFTEICLATRADLDLLAEIDPVAALVATAIIEAANNGEDR